MVKNDHANDGEGKPDSILLPEDVTVSSALRRRIEDGEYVTTRIKQPDDTQIVERFSATHLTHPLFAEKMINSILEGNFSEYAAALLLGNPFRADDVDAIFQQHGISMRSSDLGEPPITWPSKAIPSKEPAVPRYMRSQKMVIIGDGPAAILLARLRHELGYDPKATKVLSKHGKLGGIWEQPRVLEEGHNTFNETQAFGATLPTTGGRSGAQMKRFLSDVAGSAVPHMLVHGEATKVDYDLLRKRYVVHYRGQISGVLEGDSVCVSTGNRIGKTLDHGPMDTNADEIPRIDVRMKRWQEPIPPEKWKEFEGTRPLIVGLGNSAMAVIGDFIEMQRNGVDVHPLVLTHHSAQALEHPREVIRRKDSNTIEGPLARHPSNLSRLALDIASVEERYRYALQNDWIIPSVKQWMIDLEAFERDRTVKVTITAAGRKKMVVDVPIIYALIGYQNDPKHMSDLGCTVDEESGFVQYDPLTHRVKSNLVGNPDRLYIAGAAGATENRNEEVIPGMMRSIQAIALAEIVAAYKSYPERFGSILGTIISMLKPYTKKMQNVIHLALAE